VIHESPRKGIDYILEKLGRPVSMEVDEEPIMEAIPCIIAYRLENGVGLSYTPLRLGTVEARLYPLTQQRLNELKEGLGKAVSSSQA